MLGAYILSALQEAGRDTVENAGFAVHFSPVDEGTRYSTYSIRPKEPEAPPPARTLLGTPKKTPSKSSKPGTPKTPTAVVEHAAVDPDASQYFAFKALPREFAARTGLTSASDDDDDDDLALESSETCAATVERIVRRIRDQCARVHDIPDGFVEDKDVVR